MQGSQPEPQVSNLGPQAQDQLMKQMLDRMRSNPKYAHLAEAVDKAPPVSLSTVAGDENIWRKGAYGMYKPSKRDVKVALLPSGHPDRPETYEKTVAHELGHHLLTSEIPWYETDEAIQRFGSPGTHERVAQTIEDAAPARAFYRPGQGVGQAEREARNIDGIVKMILQAHKYKDKK